MECGPIIVISIIIIALIAALVIPYYQSASTKAVAAQCDKNKKVCQVQSETTHFGGYFPVYSYYYVSLPFYGPGLGTFYRGSIVNTPSVCDNCLNKITPQDEQDIQNSKAPVSQSYLPSATPTSQSENNNPNPSGPSNPTEQSPTTSENPTSPGSSEPSAGGAGGESGGSSGGGGGGEGG